MAKTAIGTPYYMSPEIFENKPYSFKSDIWSLGCVLYEMCARKPPFNAASMAGLMRQIIRGQYVPLNSEYSQSLRKLVDQCLTLDPKRRPNCAEILQQPIIRQAAVAFFTDLVTLSGKSSSSGQSTGMEASKHAMDVLTKQLNTLGMKDAVQQAMSQGKMGGRVQK